MSDHVSVQAPGRAKTFGAQLAFPWSVTVIPPGPVTPLMFPQGDLGLESLVAGPAPEPPSDGQIRERLLCRPTGQGRSGVPGFRPGLPVLLPLGPAVLSRRAGSRSKSGIVTIFA